MSATFQFRVLGPLDVRVNGGPGPHLPPLRRRLLAVLLARAGRPYALGELADEIWSGTPPRSAGATLQVHLHRLRRALDDSPHIARDASGYRIDVTEDECDATRFAALLARARAERAHAPEAAAAALEQALELWRGDAYADIETSNAVAAEAMRLEEERLTAERELCELRIELGRPEAAVGPLTRLSEAQPYHERLAALLMLALYRSGRQADALAVYRDRRARLRDDLGVDPGGPLQRLHEAVLRADPRLDAVAPASLDGTWTTPEPAPAAAPPALPVPRELPLTPHAFTGRERELQTLHGLLDGLLNGAQDSPTTPAAAPIAVVTGMGGIGKTALAIHWGHRVEDRFPDGQLFIDLRGQGDAPLDPLEALTAMLGALGVPPGQVPDDIEQAAARLRTRIGDRRMLIVLDNAASGEQVRPLLPGGTGSLTIVTSRHRLTDLVVRHGAARLTLEPLRTEDARSLVATLLRRPGDEDGVAALAALCGRLPLALHIAAANLADNPQYDIAAYVDRLANGDLLNSLQVRGSADAAIRAVFESTYRNLPGTGRRLFRMLGLVPGPDFTVEAAASLLGAGVDDTEPVLDSLVAVHLVEHHRPGRYRFHDLLRRYAEERAASEEDPESREAARERLFAWYLHRVDAVRSLLYPELTVLDGPEPPERPYTPTAEEASAWLEAERCNLIAAVRHAAEHGPAAVSWRLYDATAGLVWLGVRCAEGVDAGERVLAAAERAGDPLGMVAAEVGLGWNRFGANHAAEAMEHGERAAKLLAETGPVRAQVGVAHQQSLAYASFGRGRDALRHAERARRLADETADIRVRLELLETLGGINMQLAEVDTAIAHFHGAEQLADRHGMDYGWSLLTNLAGAYLAQGRVEDVEACIAREAALEAGNAVASNPNYASTRTIARAHLAAGRTEEARRYANAAVEMLGEHPTSLREAIVRSTVGAVLDACGDHAEAIAEFDQVIELTARGWFYFRVEAMLGRATALLHLGEFDRAREEAEWTLRAALDSGYRGPEGRARNLLAELAIATDRPDEAEAHARAGLATNRAIGHRPIEAESLQLLTRLARQRGETEEADRLHGEAVAILTETGGPLPEATG